MIGYLEGKIIHTDPDRILLQAGAVGYEVIVNPYVLDILTREYSPDDDISLYIYHHQTERQPKPVLIGFITLADKAFFQQFITVDAIGPLKAVKAMDRPVSEIAAAIENKNVTVLSSLTGVGKRSAEKIIAQLNGKVGQFAAGPAAGRETAKELTDILPDAFTQVFDVLVEQLGHAPVQAKKMIEAAAAGHPDRYWTPEKLFDAIFSENDHQKGR